MRTLVIWVALLGLLLGCPPDPVSDDDISDDDISDDDAADDDASDDDASDDDVADDDASDDDASDDDASDDDTSDPCAGYRTQYPSGPYGTNVNSVLEDFPGMVDGQGNPHDLGEIFADTSKVALVIANAFDT